MPFVEAVAGELHTVKRVFVLDDVGRDFVFDEAIRGHSAEFSSTRPRGCTQPDEGSEGRTISPASPIPLGPPVHPKRSCCLGANYTQLTLALFHFTISPPSDVFYCTTSHAHFGSKAIPYLAAMVGGQVVIRPRFALNSFWQDIARFGITTGMLVGTMADMLLRNPDSPSGHTSLKNLFMAPLGACYRQFSERFGVRICTCYNSTEGGVAIRSDWNPRNERTVGRLREGYPGFEVRLVDEHDFEVPDGTPGECIVRASLPWVLNAGYLHNPEATALAWRNGWFHTGDALIRTADGDYIFVDRLKDVIRRRGENISSFEVEADVLLDPDIVECAAVAVPADTAEDEILLFAVKRSGVSISPQELCGRLESRMTRFMVPRYIEFLESLPKTQATQRIIKAELRQRGLGARTWDRQTKAYLTGSGAVLNEG